MARQSGGGLIGGCIIIASNAIFLALIPRAFAVVLSAYYNNSGDRATSRPGLSPHLNSLKTTGWRIGGVDVVCAASLFCIQSAGIETQRADDSSVARASESAGNWNLSGP